MDTQTAFIGVILLMLGAFALMFRAQAKTATNAADAQAMINKRFEKLDETVDQLREKNGKLEVELAGYRTANELLTSSQATERALAETRAEKYGELQARVSSLTTENVASHGESKGWQKLAEELKIELNGFPKQIADLEAIVRRLGAATPAATETAIADAKPDSAPPSTLPPAAAIEHVEINAENVTVNPTAPNGVTLPVTES